MTASTLPPFLPTPVNPAIDLPPTRTLAPTLEYVVPPTPDPAYTPAAIAPAVTTPAQPLVEPSPVPPDQQSEPNVIATLDAGFTPRVIGTYPSPDRYLEAEVRSFDCADFGNGQSFAYEVLVMRDVITEQEEAVASQMIACGGLGGYGLAGLYWSSDGRFFYYTDAREGGPDGCGYWQRSIIRHDLINHVNIPLGFGPVAPNASQLASWQGRALYVHNLSKDEPLLTIEAAIPDAEIGPIAWAPDSRTLAYLQPRGWCPLGATSVVLVSLDSGQQRVLVVDHALGFSGVEWLTPSTISLFDESGQRWALDPASGEITQP